jgi:hypothetical protein
LEDREELVLREQGEMAYHTEDDNQKGDINGVGGTATWNRGTAMWEERADHGTPTPREVYVHDGTRYECMAIR